MRYTVIWQPLAEEKLATIWIDAADRGAITVAAIEIDRRLKKNPESLGESRGGNTRWVVVPPLAVHFDVHQEDRVVRVLTVRSIPTRPAET
jgi:hypothetical protein